MRKKNTEIKFLSKKQLTKLFNSITNTKETNEFYLRDLTMFNLAYYCWLRISEICLLEKDNILTIDGALYLDIVDGKTDNASRVIPVHSNIKDIITNCLLNTNSTYLFNDGKINATTKKINRALNKIIPNPNKTFHCFRKNFTAKLYDNYAQYEVYIKVLVGHSTKNNITFYTYAGQKLDNNMKIKMIESIKYDI